MCEKPSRMCPGGQPLPDLLPRALAAIRSARAMALAGRVKPAEGRILLLEGGLEANSGLRQESIASLKRAHEICLETHDDICVARMLRVEEIAESSQTSTARLYVFMIGLSRWRCDGRTAGRRATYWRELSSPLRDFAHSETLTNWSLLSPLNGPWRNFAESVVIQLCKTPRRLGAARPKKDLMKYHFALIAFIFTTTMAFAQTPAAPAQPRPAMVETPNSDSYYQFSPDALPQDGVPKGELKGPFVLPSQAYPGTQHTYWIYVPAQYDPATPASLMIYNDGQAFMAPDGDVHAPTVMDNLIFRREIPVMIAVFINPGRRPDQPEPVLSNWGDRDTNRPTEYNTLDDKYAKVIVDELLPVLYKDYNISKDPDRHGIGGSSSGAIAAFTVAWERPDQFHKVLSNVGSFTNIRGGNAYPDIIRKAEKKPLRVFLVDGRNDNRSLRVDGSYDEGRDWFYQNVRMQQALTDKGYELNYPGASNDTAKMLRTVFPDMMRWLWRDHGFPPILTTCGAFTERLPKNELTLA